MTTAKVQFDAEYGESWDPQRRTLAGPMPVADARRRHLAGEPYAALLRGSGQTVLVEVELRKDEITAWRLDAHLRRASLFEFRTLVVDRMALIRMAEWRYAAADRPEFDTGSPRCLTTFGVGGKPVVQAIDAPESAFRALATHDRWVDQPGFGSWKPLATFVLDSPPERDRHRVVPHAPHERPAAPAGEPPIARQGCPMQPGPEIVTMFGPPTRYLLEADEHGGTPEVVVETRPAGMLRLPTGQLVVADPGHLATGGREALTATFPRGRHPVTLALARFAENPEHVRVAGCRVDVRDVAPVTWEQALFPGQDPSTLGDGEFFGVGVDAGLLSFFDAAALPGLVEASRHWDEPRGLWEELSATVLAADSVELEDPETGTNLIAFRIGWGDGAYPVWIGRAGDGEVARIVADGMVLSDATCLGPVE
jgi:hypothetical protein